MPRLYTYTVETSTSQSSKIPLLEESNFALSLYGSYNGIDCDANKGYRCAACAEANDRMSSGAQNAAETEINKTKYAITA